MYRNYAPAVSTIVLAAAALSGCATPEQTTTLEDGSMAFTIECDGTARGLNACLERAGRSCGATGYVLVDNTGRRVADSTSESGETLIKDFSGDRNGIMFQCEDAG